LVFTIGSQRRPNNVHPD